VTAAPRPDRNLSVQEILEQWLPQRFAELGHRMPPDCPRLRVTVKGSASCPETDLLYSVSEHEMTCSRTFDADEADVWVRFSHVDFQALLHRDPDLPPLVPVDRDLVDLMVVDAADLDRFAQLSGRLALEIQGRKRRRFSLDVAFGSLGFKAGRPRSTISIDGAALEALMNGSKAPLQALLEGRVRVDGDRALAMQALMLVAATTARRR